MRPLKALVSLETALGQIMELATPIERVVATSLLGARGRVVAEDVASPMDVPSHDRAAMDGYAVRAADTFPAGRFSPVELTRLETLHANGVPTKRVEAGTCVEVATGATLPRGADAVVMVEDTEKAGDQVKVYTPVHPRENVSERGEDIRRGDLVVAEGDLLNPSKIGALAAIGLEEVRVYAQPEVGILATGDEVVSPGEPLQPGQVYDINSFTLASVVADHGGVPRLLPRAPDAMDALRSSLERALAYDLVVFSGGSSVGEKDLIMDVLAAMGELLFHGVAVKPGKPTVLGRIADTPVLGMPGYPTSCLSNAYLMLVPMLRAMARLPPRTERIERLPLSRRLVSTVGRVEFHTVRVRDGQAVPAYKESSAITSMAHADGYIEIPANVDLLEKGETVDVHLF
jgi:molybdenum cofactor synthesis domain-containing protein